eukprot:GHVT01010705.1.p1 GENE.GHVT01010705.1~~GHVT01010705.1.p1  ORF type:complete len:237 (-),score=32.72 GHVT01010705.1:196-906(-)
MLRLGTLESALDLGPRRLLEEVGRRFVAQQLRLLALGRLLLEHLQQRVRRLFAVHDPWRRGRLAVPLRAHAPGVGHARMLQTMKTARSAARENILRTRLLPNRTSAQTASRLEHLGGRRSLCADGNYSLTQETPDTHVGGRGTKEELRQLQMGLNRAEKYNSSERTTPWVYSNGVAIKFKTNIKQSRGRGLLVENDEGYKITEPQGYQFLPYFLLWLRLPQASYLCGNSSDTLNGK